MARNFGVQTFEKLVEIQQIELLKSSYFTCPYVALEFAVHIFLYSASLLAFSDISEKIDQELKYFYVTLHELHANLLPVSCKMVESSPQTCCQFSVSLSPSMHISPYLFFLLSIWNIIEYLSYYREAVWGMFH